MDEVILKENQEGFLNQISNESFFGHSENDVSERRRHPRFILFDSPIFNESGVEFKLMDMSQSGFCVYSDKNLIVNNSIWLKTNFGKMLKAKVVCSRPTSYETSFLPLNLKHQIHCEFEDVLAADKFGELLNDYHLLTIHSDK